MKVTRLPLGIYHVLILHLTEIKHSALLLLKEAILSGVRFGDFEPIPIVVNE